MLCLRSIHDWIFFFWHLKLSHFVGNWKCWLKWELILFIYIEAKQQHDEGKKPSIAIRWIEAKNSQRKCIWKVLWIIFSFRLSSKVSLSGFKMELKANVMFSLFYFIVSSFPFLSNVYSFSGIVVSRPFLFLFHFLQQFFVAFKEPKPT